MKKSVRKPQNWQDFENLCQMLWGEIWGIPEKIKKNGRPGQAQSGVDIYGIPKNKLSYSAIQCKDKDDYSNAKLNKSEIDKEIEKAKTFQPALETFIFATTANKDVEIEKYIRNKDIENRKNGSFEILIYCWEDIANLIELNRQTYNYYVLENQFKSNFEIDLTFSDGSKILTLNPKFKKIIKKYVLKNVKDKISPFNYLDKPCTKFATLSPVANVNNSWTTISICFKNSGSNVLEDFKLFIYPEKNKFRNLAGYEGGRIAKISYLQNSSLYVFEDEPEGERYAVYKDKNNAPLIQNDSRIFKLYILPLLENYEMQIDFKLLARDYSQKGNLKLKIIPEYEIEEKTILVDNEDDLKEDIVKIEDIMTKGSFF